MNNLSQKQKTLLQLAVERSDLDTVVTLISITDPNENNCVALYTAVENNNVDAVKLLLPFYDPNTCDHKLLRNAVNNNFYSVVEALLPVYQTTGHDTILNDGFYYAISNNDVDLVRLFSTHKIDLSDRTANRCTWASEEIFDIVLPLFNKTQNNDALIKAGYENNNKTLIQKLIPLADYYYAEEFLANKGVAHTLLTECIYEYEALLQRQTLQESIKDISNNSVNKRKM